MSGTVPDEKVINEATYISEQSNNPILKFGSYGDGKGTFYFPWGITTDGEDCLYVVDAGTRLIQKFSATGEFLSQFRVNGHDEDCTTLSMALDRNNGLICCADASFKGNSHTKVKHMLVFNVDGELQHMHELTDIFYPMSIAMDSHGDIFIPELHKKYLFKVDKEGIILSSMGDIEYPGDIAIADDDSIIVSDCEDDCIYVFNPDGSVRHKFGSSGSENGELKEPYGVAYDGVNILVADSGNNRIQVFTCDGQFVSIIESQNDPLKNPKGLVVTKDGCVYVVDHDNHCIKKYRYKEVPLWQRKW